MTSSPKPPTQGRSPRPSLSGSSQASRADEPIVPYFRFRKELFDSLLRALSGVELEVALVIERLTTGHYAQTDAEISVSVLARRTGRSKNAVLSARRHLIQEGVVVKLGDPTNRRAARLALNRDTSSWGAFSLPPDSARGEEMEPLGSGLCTPGGESDAPLGVHCDDPLDGLNGKEEPLELAGPSGDPEELSPDVRRSRFIQGVRDAPDFLLAKLACGEQIRQDRS